MHEIKFIIIAVYEGSKTIALDNIASIEKGIGGTRIVLKELKHGENVEVITHTSYECISEVLKAFSVR